ncbi:hypothetical protein BJ741DRAFT_597326 [Chytriomyces cf. hyalinus JEL632]|nr:hypothetical protein BJ741DRAFT_597326 [Chytriomyces cf. hyalinus JEL632]
MNSTNELSTTIITNLYKRVLWLESTIRSMQSDISQLQKGEAQSRAATSHIAQSNTPHPETDCSVKVRMKKRRRDHVHDECRFDSQLDLDCKQPVTEACEHHREQVPEDACSSTANDLVSIVPEDLKQEQCIETVLVSSDDESGGIESHKSFAGEVIDVDALEFPDTPSPQKFSFQPIRFDLATSSESSKPMSTSKRTPTHSVANSSLASPDFEDEDLTGKQFCTAYQLHKCLQPKCFRMHYCALCHGHHGLSECPLKPKEWRSACIFWNIAVCQYGHENCSRLHVCLGCQSPDHKVGDCVVGKESEESVQNTCVNHSIGTCKNLNCKRIYRCMVCMGDHNLSRCLQLEGGIHKKRCPFWNGGICHNDHCKRLHECLVCGSSEHICWECNERKFEA